MQKTNQKSAVKERMNHLADTQTPDKFVENVAKLRQQEDSYHVYAKKALRGDKILQEYEQSSAKMKNGGHRHQLLAKDVAHINTTAGSRSSLSTGKTRAARKTVMNEHHPRLENVAEQRAGTRDARGRKSKVQSATATKKQQRLAPKKDMVFNKNSTLKSSDASPMAAKSYGMQTSLSGLNSRSSQLQNMNQTSSLLNDMKVSVYRPNHEKSVTPLKRNTMPLSSKKAQNQN